VAAARSESRAPADEPIIEITRLLDAPRALVWMVWTDPKHAGEWWGPDGFSVTTHAMNVVPGGVWDYVMHGPDGRDYDNLITFHEVVKPERLVYSHGEPGDPNQFHVTVTFTEEAGKTRVRMHSVFPSVAARDFVAREFGAVEGGRQHLDNLAAYLARQQHA
jgi:uncharacterized protein YndB with AHSA1/START domain